MALNTSFRLSTIEVDKWREALVSAIRDDKGNETLLYGLERYPGELGPGHVLVDGSFERNLIQCVQKIFLENEDFSRSFLLRALERRWDEERLREDILYATPALVRPQPGFDRVVETLTGTLASLLETLDPDPEPGRVGDRRIYARLCSNREKIMALQAALDEIEALKAFHDALLALNSEGAEWLDRPRPAGAPQEPPDILAGLAIGTAVALEALPDRVLQQDEAASRDRCAATCRDAARRIATGDTDEIRFAIDILRSLMEQDFRAVAMAMFDRCRDLPLREFRSIFAERDTAIVAAVELCDRLRRRMMALNIWQDCDYHIRRIEEAFANPASLLFPDLRRRLASLRRNFAALMGLPPQMQGPTASLDFALHAYDKALAPNAAAETLESMPEPWIIALAELRETVRARFLDQSVAMQADLAQILVLRPSLDAVLRRVARSCKEVLALS